MRLRQVLVPVAVFLLLGCAADDGFRPRLVQGCRSEMECAQLATLADARAASCQNSNDPNVVLRVHLDLRPSAPPCDEVEADRRVAHDYLERFVQERERQAAWAAQQEAIRRGDEQARWNADQERQRAADETERRRAAEEAERRQRDATAQADIQRMDAQYQAERAAREKAEREAASAPRSSSTLPATPAPRDTGGHVCCCDGTLSPTCTTVHRGCCSHHGGVCACE